MESVRSPTSEDCSPVSELSFGLQNLQCQDGLSPKSSAPWRKLLLTPECTSPPRNTLSRDRETPTVSAVRRRRARSLSPESSSHTPVCQWRVRHDSPADKETERAFKRLRVRLSSRFFSSEEAEAAGRSWRQCRSDPEEDASVPRQTHALDPTAVERFSQLRSRRDTPLTHVTQDDVADLTLIGDFSKVASLIRGQFGPAVEDFLIVDCRYPYEYQGGHIKGAVNLYMESQIQQAVHWDHPSDSRPEDEGSSPRKLIVFHCEFSSERGPHLCQYLRRLDRCVNAQVYPNLHYPELYLLLGGYKHFHASYPDLCDPCGYVPMRQREYREQLHGFRRKRPTRQRRRRPIRIHQRTTH